METAESMKIIRGLLVLFLFLYCLFIGQNGCMAQQLQDPFPASPAEASVDILVPTSEGASLKLIHNSAPRPLISPLGLNSDLEDLEPKSE